MLRVGRALLDGSGPARRDAITAANDRKRVPAWRTCHTPSPAPSSGMGPRLDRHNASQCTRNGYEASPEGTHVRARRSFTPSASRPPSCPRRPAVPTAEALASRHEDAAAISWPGAIEEQCRPQIGRHWPSPAVPSMFGPPFVATGGKAETGLSLSEGLPRCYNEAGGTGWMRASHTTLEVLRASIGA